MIKSLTNFIYHRVSHLSFGFISCEKICKYHKVTGCYNYACKDYSNFKNRGIKMFLLKLGSELQNLFQKLWNINKIQYIHEVKWRGKLFFMFKGSSSGRWKNIIFESLSRRKHWKIFNDILTIIAFFRGTYWIEGTHHLVLANSE